MYILALEASTTSAKAMLYNTADGSVEVRARAYTGNYEDVTIHKAENIFLQMARLGNEVASEKKVECISLGGTWHGSMLCDKNMQPETPVYLWSYTGASEISAALRRDTQYTKWFFDKTGCMVNAIYPFFKLQLLRQQGYKLEDYRILDQGTYNNYRITGQFATTECLASGSGLLNVHEKAYDADILKNLGVSENHLPTVSNSTKAYPLTEEAAELLGITPGIPVILTNADGGLNQIGVGASKRGVMTFSVGTSGAMRMATDMPVLPDHPSAWCYVSPTGWLSGAATNGCCNCVDWIKNRLFSPNTSYEEIEKGIKNRDNPPIFLPFIFGERCPGWNDERRGGFCNISQQHIANDMYLAVLEGVLFNLYQCYETLIDLNGAPDRIKLSGGIIHSGMWTQMCADIFQKEMEVDKSEHASLMGGVALAMNREGLISDLNEFDLKPSQVFYPDAEKKEHYKEKYERYLDYYHNSLN